MQKGLITTAMNLLATYVLWIKSFNHISKYIATCILALSMCKQLYLLLSCTTYRLHFYITMHGAYPYIVCTIVK